MRLSSRSDVVNSQSYRQFIFQDDWIRKRFWIKLQVKQHHHMEDHDCSPNSYYGCFAFLIKSTFNVSQCLPKSAMSIGNVDLTEFEQCKTDSEAEKSWNQLYQVFQSMDDFLCPKLCAIEVYTGKIDYEENKSITNLSNFSLIVDLRYARPYTVSVSREYLIYDFIGMVGSVGGTLGMFIGFSFYEIVRRIFEFLKKWF